MPDISDSAEDFVEERPLSERVRRMRRRAEEETSDAIRRMEESGEIRHLHGRPLQLNDDPEWLAARVLKQAGFTHPVLERARDLDEPTQAAEDVLDRLRRRRAALAQEDARYLTAEGVDRFNEFRRQRLEEYREKLVALNKAIRDFNLMAPDALHRRPILIENALRRAGDEIPPLEWHPPPPRSRSWPWNFRRRTRA